MLNDCNTKSSEAFLWYKECCPFITKFSKQPQAVLGFFDESEPNACVNLNFPSTKEEGKGWVCAQSRGLGFIYSWFCHSLLVQA